MLKLRCPYCGFVADETELANGGEAHLKRAGADSSDEEFEAYLFMRKNPKGVHFELWRHSFGCGKWFHAARCTESQEVFGTYPGQAARPPDLLIETIARKRPGWSYSDWAGKRE